MARIIAGTHGGRTIAVPSKGTRPTTDRVREALFARLDHYDLIDGAAVLDLYAGSGALGLESASRGAERVVLVEAARTAAQVCRDNVDRLGLRGVVAVVAQKVESYVAHPAAPSAVFTLAFVDPPYELGESELTAVLAGLVGHLDPDAVVVVERSVRSPEPALPRGLTLWETRTYGETALHLLDRTQDDGAGLPHDDHPQA